MGRHARIAELATASGYATGEHDLVVADLGCGQGRTVRELLAAGATRVHAVDQASSLDDDLLTDPRVSSRIVDLNAGLPFAPGAVHRAVSLNVAEHLQDPVAHLRDIHRMLADDGLLVLAHSDWDTILFTSEHDDLTRVLVDRFVATSPRWAERSDGFMGRKLLRLAASAAPQAGFEVVQVDSWADPHRRFDEGSLAWKVAVSVLASAQDDDMLSAQAAGWLEGLRRLAGQDRFLFTVTDVAVCLRKT